MMTTKVMICELMVNFVLPVLGNYFVSEKILHFC